MTVIGMTSRCIGGRSGINRRLYGLCLRCDHAAPGATGPDIQPMAYRDASGVTVCPNFTESPPGGSHSSGLPGAAMSPAFSFREE